MNLKAWLPYPVLAQFLLAGFITSMAAPIPKGIDPQSFIKRYVALKAYPRSCGRERRLFRNIHTRERSYRSHTESILSVTLMESWLMAKSRT
jgi:hypothetical protein